MLATLFGAMFKFKHLVGLLEMYFSSSIKGEIGECHIWLTQYRTNEYWNKDFPSDICRRPSRRAGEWIEVMEIS